MVHFDYDPQSVKPLHYVLPEGMVLHDGRFTNERADLLHTPIILRCPGMGEARFRQVVSIATTLDPRIHYRVYPERRELLLAVPNALLGGFTLDLWMLLR